MIKTQQSTIRNASSTSMVGSVVAFVLVLLAGMVLFPVPVFASTPVAAKAYVKESGFYRVSKSSLAQIFSTTESQIATMPLRVSNIGRDVPSFRDNGDVVFYGHRFQTRFTDENVYWIQVGAQVAPVEFPVSSGSTPFAASFPATVHLEQQLVTRAELVYDIDEDPILWRLLNSGLSTRFFNVTLGLEQVAPNTGGTITVRVKGATEASGRYFHRARVDLNGTTLGFIDFEGYESKQATFTVPSGAWNSGNNTVRIESTPPPGTSFDSFYLDFVTANYQRSFVAANDRLNMHQVSGALAISGLTGPNLELWDVTDQWNARRLVGYSVLADGSLWRATALIPTTSDLAILRIGAERVPARITAATVKALKAKHWAVDHLAIAAPHLYSTASVLTDYRQSNGLDSLLLDVEEVYDAFNYGIRDPQAIAIFLAYAYRNWTKSPLYVVLVGDGSLDYKNGTGFNDSPIPAFPFIGPNGLYATDYRYGDVNGNGRVEMAVGRIPVNTPAALNSYIQKVIHYEAGGTWRDLALVSTDQSDYGGNYFGEGNNLQEFILDRDVARADVDILGASMAREQLIDGINSGKELSLYIGHGTPGSLSLQNILLTSDALSFTNKKTPSAFVMLGCLVGTFGGPGSVSIGEGMIIADGAAVAFIAAATMISVNDGKVLTEPFLNGIYLDGVGRMGDAYIRGKNSLTPVGRHSAYRGFQFLGDPGLATGLADAPRGEDIPSADIESYEVWQQITFPPVYQYVGENLLPEGDIDGDSFNNWSEFIAGTDPLDGDSLLRVVTIKRLPGNRSSVSWPSVSGRVYSLEAATSVVGAYQIIASDISALPPTNVMEFDDPAHQLRYFRVSVE